MGPTPELEKLVDQMARLNLVEPYLLRAIVTVESSWNPWAIRYEPGWRYFFFPRETASRIGITEATENFLQASSWGLCQIMGSVAREYGFQGMLTELTRPETALLYGAKHLHKFMVKYGGGNVEDVIAAYNAGSARKTSGGMYENQEYVTKVMQVVRTNQFTPVV